MISQLMLMAVLLGIPQPATTAELRDETSVVGLNINGMLRYDYSKGFHFKTTYGRIFIWPTTKEIQDKFWYYKDKEVSASGQVYLIKKLDPEVYLVANQFALTAKPTITTVDDRRGRDRRSRDNHYPRYRYYYPPEYRMRPDPYLYFRFGYPYDYPYPYSYEYPPPRSGFQFRFGW